MSEQGRTLNYLILPLRWTLINRSGSEMFIIEIFGPSEPAIETNSFHGQRGVCQRFIVGIYLRLEFIQLEHAVIVSALQLIPLVHFHLNIEWIHLFP